MKNLFGVKNIIFNNIITFLLRKKLFSAYLKIKLYFVLTQDYTHNIHFT